MNNEKQFFGQPWQDWIDEYQLSHQNKYNRWCHFLGIPLVAISCVLLILSIFFNAIFPIAISIFIVGWIFQFLGHYFEKKPPEFLKDWRFLFVGLRWWFQKALKL